jgi:hypothetical protein
MLDIRLVSRISVSVGVAGMTPQLCEPALTEIEIALRKEENPSENVQWAIERINRLQETLDVGGILESLCKTDLYWYNKGVTEGEDVGKCRGKDCNYCGRYNEKLRQAGEP